MKLAVISPETHDPRELSVVRALFAAGLERYHLRKPNWSVAELETWLRGITPAERASVMVHGHPELVQRWGLAGAHARDDGKSADKSTSSSGSRSRAVHDLDTLGDALGHFGAVLLGPVFASLSKPGHGPSNRIDLGQLSRVLENRTLEQRRTTVFALGGVDLDRLEACHRLGFDGVAVLGAIWTANDPVETFTRLQHRCGTLCAAGKRFVDDAPRRIPSTRCTVFSRHAVMCLTQDRLPLSHVAQATRLCAAGARWIQLRMKEAEFAEWLATAQTVAAICREYGAVFIVNDSVEIALQVEAAGVHLGKLDLEWVEARRRLGPERLLGGTINNAADAAKARTAGCLDYVGVGPWRFTSNKKNLAPVLGADGVRGLIGELGDLPAWVIGGIEAADLPSVRATGAAGVAVSSALYRRDEVETNFRKLSAAWPTPLVGGPPHPPGPAEDTQIHGGHGGPCSNGWHHVHSARPVIAL